MTAQLISSYTIDYDILTQGFIRNFRKSNKLSRDLSADVINLVIQFYYSIQPACVIDNGSGLIKTGFSGSPVPSSVTPSIVGKLNYKNAKPLMVTRFNTVGDERIYKYPQIFSWQHPVQHGIITNFGAMEKIWHHSFYQELHIDPERTHILLTEPPLNPKANREKTTQIMFESFNVKGLYIAVGEVLSLYASGRTTGVVLGSGDRVTHAVPIYEGNYLQHAVQRLDLAGKDCTDYLMNRLTQKGNIFDTFRTTNAERKIVKNIKETLCFVALDFGWEYHKDVRQNYQLPDGQIITVEEERYRTPEILFQPNYLIGSNQEGIHKILFNSIMECNDAIKNKLFENIVLSGGNTMFEGFAKRMEKEMETLATDTCKIKIIAPEQRAYLEWIGGSILSSLSSFETMWISKGEYDEYGPSIVHRKCS